MSTVVVKDVEVVFDDAITELGVEVVAGSGDIDVKSVWISEMSALPIDV